MAAANAGFLVLLFDTIQDATTLGLFLLTGYLLYQCSRVLRAKYITAISIGVLTLVFIYLKQYSFIEFVPKLSINFQDIGISYIYFRIVHLIVDDRHRLIEGQVGLIDYLNFTCNFLTFISGPITRVQGFKQELMVPEPMSDDSLVAGIGRIALGYFKLLVVAAVIGLAFDVLKQQLLVDANVVGPALFVYCLAAALYTAFLYYNFSGSIDVVIGFGRLAGMKIPENFNRPFLSKNMIEFWGRWHMTLSEWFKKYLFTPFLVFLLKTFPSPQYASMLGVLAYFLVFTVMGIWHGSTYIFLIYGLFLGAGLAGNKLYQDMMVKYLGRKKYKELSARPIYVYASRGLTIGYFSISLSSFWMTIDDVSTITSLITPAGIVVAILVNSVAWGISAACLDAISPKVVAFARTIQNSAQKLTLPGLQYGYPTFATLLIVTFIVHMILNRPAEIVYGNF